MLDGPEHFHLILQVKYLGRRPGAKIHDLRPKLTEFIQYEYFRNNLTLIKDQYFEISSIHLVRQTAPTNASILSELLSSRSSGYFSWLVVVILFSITPGLNAQQLQPFFWLPTGEYPNGTSLLNDKEWVEAFNELDLAASLSDRKVLEAKLHSQYVSQDVLLRGRLNFNHPLTSYINDIKNYLLREHPGLRDSINVLVEVTPEPGAFMSITGELRFTTGMFNRCNSEAQIAGIVAHEIIHFQERHSEKSIRSPFGTNDSDVVQLASLQTRYSHKRELEADSKALESFMKKSDYKLEDVSYLFDVLAYSYLPLMDEPVAFELLIPECYADNAAKYFESPRPITPKEKLDDSRSSHPNAYRRQIAYLEQLQKTNYTNGSGKEYILKSKQEFDELQAKARYEERYMQAVNHNYLHVLYEELRDGNLPSILKSHALWAVATIRNDNRFDREFGVFSDYEGELSTLYWFLRSIPSKDLTIMAYLQAVAAKQAHPNSELLDRVLVSLAGQASRFHSMKTPNWTDPMLCGIKDTTAFRVDFVDGVARASQSANSSKSVTIYDFKTATKRPVERGPSTLLPASLFFTLDGMSDVKTIAKHRQSLEGFLQSKLTSELPGAMFSYSEARLNAPPEVRKKIWAMECFFHDVIHMANWNSCVSLFTDQISYWEDLKTYPRFTKISAGNPNELIFVTIDSESQRVVDAVRGNYYPTKSKLIKLANFWLQSLEPSSLE